MRIPFTAIKKKEKHSTTITDASTMGREDYAKTREDVRANLSILSALLDETLESLRKPPRSSTDDNY